MKRLVLALGFAALLAQSATAQVIPGDSPKMGIGSAVANSGARPVLGLSRSESPSGYTREELAERSRRGTPATKRADPWATIRSSSENDRHRAY